LNQAAPAVSQPNFVLIAKDFSLRSVAGTPSTVGGGLKREGSPTSGLGKNGQSAGHQKTTAASAATDPSPSKRSRTNGAVIGVTEMIALAAASSAAATATTSAAEASTTAGS